MQEGTICSNYNYLLHICPKRIKKDPSNKVDKFDWTIKSTKQYRGINDKCNTFQSNNAANKPKLI